VIYRVSRKKKEWGSQLTEEKSFSGPTDAIFPNTKTAAGPGSFDK